MLIRKFLSATFVVIFGFSGVSSFWQNYLSGTAKSSLKHLKYKNMNVRLSTEEDLSDQYAEWEQEEIKRFKIEAEQRRAEDDDADIPEYMKKLLDDYSSEEESFEPVPEGKLPVIAVIGRPNTGKSTIVNKLTNSYKDGAIVHDEPGITRDRTYRVGFWCDYNFQVVDTGGIIFDDTQDIFAERITQQALIALAEADVAILVCDGQEGVTQLDSIIADWLRKKNDVPVYCVVNKCESETVGSVQAQEFWILGLGEPYPVSGIHGTGLAELLDQLTTKHMMKITNVIKDECTNIALVGRPNVGKSSLFNRFHGKERAIVSDVAGTTRDTLDVNVVRGNQTFRIVDTAGIRKRGKVNYGAEFFMVNRAFKAIRRAEVAVLLLDATTGIVDQDRILAERISKEGRACVIALNKWDAVPDKDDKSYQKAVENIRLSLPVLRWAEVILISALYGQRTEKLFEAVSRAASQFGRRIPTAVLNEVVNDATLWMAPPSISSRSGRIYYCIQVSVAPPTIVFFVNDPDLFTDNYRRYLERKVRDGLNFGGTPIRMIWRGKSIRSVGRAARKGDVGALASGAMSTSRVTKAQE